MKIMSESYIKEKVAYYKLWLTLFVAIDSGIIAWAFNNYVKIGSIRFFMVYFAIILVTSSIIAINQKTRRFIERMGD